MFVDAKQRLNEFKEKIHIPSEYSLSIDANSVVNLSRIKGRTVSIISGLMSQDINMKVCNFKPLIY